MKTFSIGMLILLFAVSAFPVNAFAEADYGTELPVTWSTVPGKMGLWRTAWSPDGKWIAVSYGIGGQDILLIPSQGGAPKNLTGDITEKCAIPQFTADSEEIAFTRYAVDENKMLIPVFEAMEITSGDRRKLAEGFAGVLSRDGKQACYQSNPSPSSPTALVVSSLEEGKTKALISNFQKVITDFGHSCFDPAGEYVATSLIISGAPELSSHKLFIIPVAGGDSVRVTTDDAAEEWYPVYSPLGTRLMYTRYVYGKDRNDFTTQAYIFDIATGKSAPLVPDAAMSTWCGCWSPDGRKVCYVVETDAGSRLYVKSVQPEDSHQLGVVSEKPAGFALKGVYPNPFNPSATISFTLNETRRVSLDVYNVAGQKVDTLLNGVLGAGEHSLTWNASGHASGVYFCRLEAEGTAEVRKMVLAR